VPNTLKQQQAHRTPSHCMQMDCRQITEDEITAGKMTGWNDCR